MYWKWSNYLKCVLCVKFHVSVCLCVGRGVGAGVGWGVVDEVNIGVGNEVGEVFELEVGGKVVWINM